MDDQTEATTEQTLPPVTTTEVSTADPAPQTAVEDVTEAAGDPPAAANAHCRWCVSLPYNQTREIVSVEPITEAEAITLYCEGMGIRCREDGTPETSHKFSTSPIIE